MWENASWQIYNLKNKLYDSITTLNSRKVKSFFNKKKFERIKETYLENLENLHKKTLSELRKDYQEFIDTMPDEMEKLKAFLGKEKLDYLPAEIDKVEAFYRRYVFQLDKINLTEEALDKMTTTYLGLAHLWHFGGEWFLESDKSCEKYGLPCMSGYGGKDYVAGIAICPFDWVYGMKSDQHDEPISEMYKGFMIYFKNNPQYDFETFREIY